MKTEALKRIIKEAVREAIQEELKEVLLEAVKAPKAVVTQPIQESISSTTHAPVTQTPKKSLAEQRQSYLDIIGETGLNLNSSHAQGFGNKPFNPQNGGNTTSPNGQLPDGEVNMDQIMGLMTK
mgnify:FL=1|jgi:hypothetical protein|tara:strand:+ start:5395 stop:5766 length:372 start_codon:yes stop_codon:yes gene_type:complete